jgi:C-terminal processing protease CtpA/Prc
MPPALAGDTTAAAMTFLASSDVVIFDMRQNGGGDPNMVAFITSYLFGPQPVHLNDFYNRRQNETRQSWTFPYVPGKRLSNKDIYILTSSRTFSGAEEFTYNLKHLKRATIVGEITGGGAHTVDTQRINDHFIIVVPSGRPINAVTKTDWEGIGEPDVRAP